MSLIEKKVHAHNNRINHLSQKYTINHENPLMCDSAQQIHAHLCNIISAHNPKEVYTFASLMEYTRYTWGVRCDAEHPRLSLYTHTFTLHTLVFIRQSASWARSPHCFFFSLYLFMYIHEGILIALHVGSLHACTFFSVTTLLLCNPRVFSFSFKNTQTFFSTQKRSACMDLFGFFFFFF